MTLQELLPEQELVDAVPAIAVTGLQYDSRKIQPGEAFFAFAGANFDGNDYVPAARRAGAVAVISEKPQPASDSGVWIQVLHGRRALASAAWRFYNQPDRRIRLMGVTGTNGKTTTVFLIDSILRTAGLRTARFGTVGYQIGDETIEAVNTTPESLDLARLFRRLEESGGSHATLEASSHALELGRLHGLAFHTAVFTNLSQDHLDFHGDMERYALAKRKLFEGCGGPPPAYGVINADDAVGRSFLQLEGFQRLSFSTRGEADIRARRVRSTFSGVRFDVTTPAGEFPVRSPLRGDFNVQNILAALGAGLTLGLETRVLQEGVENCGAVPGRFEAVDEGQPFLVIVDYAHTPDALENLIRSARRLVSERGRVLIVFGCGGDRDRAKRPLMGEAAGRSSDRVILTSDNPRTEDPLRILADAEVGLQRVDANCIREPDRREAIRRALNEAAPGDIVLLAGKGHETYQEIGRKRFPFDDREVARQLLREKSRGRRAG